MAQKRRAYFVELLIKAKEDLEISEIIGELLGGVLIAFIAIKSGLEEQAQMNELIFECIGCAISVPFIAFMIRVVFTAPAKLYREISEEKKRGKQAETQVEEPKECHLISVLSGICSMLVLAVIMLIILGSPVKSKSGLAENHKKETEPHNVLPDKILPKPENEPAIPTDPQTPIQTQNDFETSNPSMENDPQLELAKAKAGRVAYVESLVKTQEIRAQFDWTNNFPIFNYTLQALYDVLTTEARKRGDGIAETKDYFQSLASYSFPKIGEPQIAEIRLQNSTNLDFKITIKTTNTQSPRFFIVSCSSGRLEIAHQMGINSFLLYTADYSDGTNLSTADSPEARNAVIHLIRMLVASQIESFKK